MLFCIINKTAHELRFLSILIREIPGSQNKDIDTIVARINAFFKKAREQTWVEILAVVFFYDAT